MYGGGNEKERKKEQVPGDPILARPLGTYEARSVLAKQRDNNTLVFWLWKNKTNTFCTVHSDNPISYLRQVNSN